MKQIQNNNTNHLQNIYSFVFVIVVYTVGLMNVANTCNLDAAHTCTVADVTANCLTRLD
jgi:hypothetical protein